MLWIAIVLVALAAIVVFWAMPGGKLWKAYQGDVRASFIDAHNHDKSLDLQHAENNIGKLPYLLQKHISNGGYSDLALMDCMLIRFHNTKFRMSPGANPMNIKYRQVNFAHRPDRHAFLTGRIAGIPLHAKDSVSDGKGSMTVVLAKLFQLFRVIGDEMDQSQLITALADAVYMPSLFLQDYMTWRTIDDATVEGEIKWNDVSAKGRFSFDECGNIIRFDTDDRYMDDNGKGSARMPWYVLYSEYREQNGYFQPGSISVKWLLPTGVDNYFVSDNIEVKYSVDVESQI